MIRKILLFSLPVFLLFLSSCGESNPVPTLESLSQSWSVSHMPAFELTLNGTGFVQNSEVRFNGRDVNVEYISGKELIATIEADDTLQAAAHSLCSGFPNLSDFIAQVIVSNPEPGGGDSDPLDFSILSIHSFTAPQYLANNQSESENLFITTDVNGYLYAVWDAKTGENLEDIFLRISTDRGTTWSSPINVSSTTDYSAVAQMCSDSTGRLYMAWMDFNFSEQSYDIYLSSSDDDGYTWASPVNVTNNPADSGGYTILADNSGAINIIWMDWVQLPGDDTYTIYFSRSVDRGATWSAPVTVFNSGCYYSPVLTADNSGTFYAVWREGTCWGEAEIYFTKSSDHGMSWTTPVNVSNTATYSGTPSISIGQNNSINLAWIESVSSDNSEVYFRQSSDGGTTWSSIVNLSNSSTYSWPAILRTDSTGNINIVWKESRAGSNGADLYYTRSTDNSVSWSFPIQIAPGISSALYHWMCVDSHGYIYLLCMESAGMYMDLVFIRSMIPGIDL